MKISIYGKNIDLNDKIKEYAEEKIGKLEKYNDRILEARVELDEDKSQQSGMKYRAEVTMLLPKDSFRAQETTTDLFAAIDLVVPKLKKQMEAYKTKYKEHKRGIKEVRGQ
jgi:putative sigma-54 modulation protein